MDDLYDNLDNYNEENTIAELQTENKELKSKLEEYAITLTKLQKEFDKLSSEYKQLELNYSSLLKTAKAEIERKTQLITNLNLEKDKMVLKAFHNKNADVLQKSRDYDNTMGHGNYKRDKYEKIKQDEKLKHFEGKKSTHHSATERKDQDNSPSRGATASLQSDLRSKLLNLAHKGQQYDPSTEKYCEVKENIMQTKNEIPKARASIRNRRKSMPAISTEMDQLSDDEDLASAASSKNIQQTNTEQYIIEKHTHNDNDFCERPKSRISETSSLEEKKSGYREQSPDRHKQRSSRYDRDKNDKHKVRHKSSHRYKRHSPDRYRSPQREYHDPYYRAEHDRHRAKGIILNSPPRDKIHYRPSRELQRTNHDRRHAYEQERSLPRSQERYSMKRRLEHGYDEFENKRLRMELHGRQFEEDQRMEFDKRSKIESHSRHLEENRKMEDERKANDTRHIADPLEIQFSSCESPDYDYRDVSNQQVKEIKYTATTKLDDPRISSKKYVFNKNDSQVVLSTAVGRNVKIVPVRKTAWGITPVTIPEALVKRPPEPEQTSRNINIEIEHPADISMESGEIFDLEDINIQNHTQKENKLRAHSSERNETSVLETKVNESKDLKNSLKNINSYKIPKHRMSVDDNKISKHRKEISLPVKPVHENVASFKSEKGSEMPNKHIDINKQQAKPVYENVDSFKCIKNSDNNISFKHIDINAQQAKPVHENANNFKSNENSGMPTTYIDNNKQKAKETKETKELECYKQDSFDIQSKNLLPSSGHSLVNKEHTQRYPSAKEVVEGDLEMSDDNCDDIEQSDRNTKGPLASTELQTKDTDKSCNLNTVKQSTDALQKVKLEPSKDKTSPGDSKKSKTKKKSKHKETKEACKSEISAKIFEKPDKKKGKEKETKSVQIKTKFSELFDDSSSLISPEDLGLAAVAAPTIRLPDKCVPFFEDALDAADLNVIKSDAIIDSIPPKKLDVETKSHSDDTFTKLDPVNTVSQEDNLEMSHNSSNEVQTELTDDVIKSIYQNLEPGVPEPEDNVVKTVIISSGVQPPILIEDNKKVLPNKLVPQLKTIQNIDLKALATSTPQKRQYDVFMDDAEMKLSDTGCNSNNNSQIASVENTAMIDKSKTKSNTLDSQSIEENVPDIRIFVKRRRKILKK